MYIQEYVYHKKEYAKQEYPKIDLSKVANAHYWERKSGMCWNFLPTRKRKA